MLKRAFLSPWFPFAVAALFAIFGLAFNDERMWALGLAGTAATYGCIDLLFVGASANSEEHGEARFDTTNKRGPNGG
jgi:hypothetical protein